jgi:hypothetical protein
VRGRGLKDQFTYAGMPNGGVRLAWIVYFRPRGVSDWLQRRDLNYFQRIHLQPSGSASVRLIDRSCPTPGTYRIDIYAGAHQLATATAPATPPAETLIPYDDLIHGIELCRPSGWAFSANGAIGITSPDRQREITIRVTPLIRPAMGASNAATITRVLHRMTRQLSPHASLLKTERQEFGYVAGTAWRLRLPGNQQGIVWASIGAHGILRTLQETFPVGNPGLLKDVAFYLSFSP